MSKNCLLFFLISVAGLLSRPVLACTCSYAGEFPEFSAKYSTVVRAKISSYGKEISTGSGRYYEMVVEVIDVVKGTYPNQQITLIGDSGMSCLNPISRSIFPLGSEHFITLSNAQIKQPLLGCSESSIRARRGFLHILDILN